MNKSPSDWLIDWNIIMCLYIIQMFTRERELERDENQRPDEKRDQRHTL